jgi:hypothetical protein
MASSWSSAYYLSAIAPTKVPKTAEDRKPAMKNCPMAACDQGADEQQNSQHHEKKMTRNITTQGIKSTQKDPSLTLS